MGKVRAKNRKKGGRYQPTGLVSVKETLQQEEQEHLEPRGAAILGQLSHPSSEEREWACRSLSHLVQEEATLRLLLGGRLVRKTTPLLLDQAYSVREAAAGLLRNLSLIGSEKTSDDLVKEDIMTPLSAMIKDCLSRLEHLSKSEEERGEEMADERTKGSSDESVSTKKGKERKRVKAEVEEQQLTQVLEQGLHLLWNLSERSPLVVAVFNKESLLPLILKLLQPSCLYPYSIVLVAAQILHTITEDNLPAIEELCSSPHQLSQLESLLQLVPPDRPDGTASNLLLKTCVAGVFQNLLPGLSSPLRSQTLRGVLALLSTVLDIDLPTLMESCTKPDVQLGSEGGMKSEEPASTSSTTSNHCEGSSKKDTSKDTSKSHDKKVHLVETTLSSVQLALEILANVCYVENDDKDDDGWEDEGEMEEIIGERAEETEMETDSLHQVPNGCAECDPDLLLIADFGIHEKIWKLSCVDVSSCQQGLEVHLQKCLGLVQSRSLIALQNLITVLPEERWGGASGWNTIWTSLFSHCTANCSDLSALVGAVQALAEKLQDTECLTLEQVQLLSQIGLTNEDKFTRANVMAVFGRLGKLILKRKEPGTNLLQVVGSSLRDCISNDVSLWVVAQALDSTFDLFGDDLCPPSLFVSLSFLPVLSQISSSFKARLRVEKKALGEQLGLVHNAQTNLPRFIEYMTARCRT